MRTEIFLVLAVMALTGCAANPSTKREPPEQVIAPMPITTGEQGCKPVYPYASRRLGEEGTVLVRAFVEPSGQASSVEVFHSSGHPRLDEAAREHYGCRKFTPGHRNGIPTAMWVEIPLNFVLQKGSQPNSRSASNNRSSSRR